MAPRPSRIAEPEAAQNLAKGVEERLKSVRKARSEAGNTNFTKAFEQGGDRAILTPSKTIETIDDLVKNTDTSTDSGKAAVKWLQETRDNIAPRINVAPRAGTSYTSPQAARDTLTNAPTPGQDITYNIPGSVGYTIQQNPKALTVQEVQARLKDWGRNASSEGSAVRDLAISDEQRINAALFGAMKDDLKAAQAASTTTADKKALGYLEQAREQTSQASKAYNALIEQGIPKFLKGKSIESISFEDLSGAYKGLNPSQRSVFREWVGQNKAESLQAIDRDVFQAFKAKHVGSLPDGTQGVDLKAMAEDWDFMLKNDPKAADAVAKALGQNLNEFSGRMKDALSFTRRIQTGSLASEGQAAQEATTAGARVAGATLGYRFNQAVKLLGDTFGAANKGIISDELALKTLLTPEGAAFLKTANLTPGSQKTLEALTNMNNAVPKLPEYIKPVAQVAGALAPNEAPAPETPMEQQPAMGGFVMPDFGTEDGTAPTQEAPTATGGFVMPEFND
jgi:hypothetical protein